MTRAETIGKLDSILDALVERTAAALVDAVRRGDLELEAAAARYAAFVRDLQVFRAETIAEVIDRGCL